MPFSVTAPEAMPAAIFAWSEHGRTTGDTNLATSSTVPVETTTGSRVTFTVPDTGRVIVRRTGTINHSASYNTVGWANYSITDAAIVNRSWVWHCHASAFGTNHGTAIRWSSLITGLTPGTTLTLAWHWYTQAGTAYMMHGINFGALISEVYRA